MLLPHEEREETEEAKEMSDLPSITLAEYKKLSKEESKHYIEGVWRKCERCNPYMLDEDCKMCFGQGTYLCIQLSALVIDSKGRLEENVDPNWRIGDKA